jgi:hypothetical protein
VALQNEILLLIKLKAGPIPPAATAKWRPKSTTSTKGNRTTDQTAQLRSRELGAIRSDPHDIAQEFKKINEFSEKRDATFSRPLPSAPNYINGLRPRVRAPSVKDQFE